MDDIANASTLAAAAATTTTDGAALCLNMIVKNEMANLERCLSSVADHIACWVIGDTGSTDGTQAFIRDFFGRRGIPGELHEFPFENFGQARNEALDRAYASPLSFDYLLLADADMELVVEDRNFRAGLTAPGYTLMQRSSVTYWNARVVRRDVGARYHGVTHEYIDVPGGAEPLRGLWYKDYASGSNRVDKFERDIRLLTEGLRKEPENNRYWFYLAQSYRDAGRHREAAEAYAKRAAMGGWDEEAWYARLQEARCLRDLDDEGGFVRTALAAFNQRPQRVEPLYDLARFYRERSMYEAAVVFCEAGLGLTLPEQDVLFVEDFVYTAGLKEEYSIAANYTRNPARKDRGFAACNWLALARDVPAVSRELAGANLCFYVQPAAAMMPSFAARRIDFTPPAGYRAMNPSLVRHDNRWLVAVRAVNYRLAEEDRDLGYKTDNGSPPRSRNFLLDLDADLTVRSAAEILPPADLPAPVYDDNSTVADLRLFSWRNGLWCSAAYRERAWWYEQVLARLEHDASGAYRLTDWRTLPPGAAETHEKNWMPLVAGDALRFIYKCDPLRLLDDQGAVLFDVEPAIAAGEFRGGSQAIAFDGGWLALIHEVLWKPADNRRDYHHRFVWFDADYTLKQVSRPFCLKEPGVEFTAGLAWHADGERLVLSYGVADCEAWLATVAADEVRRILDDAECLPFGAVASLPAGVAMLAPAARQSDGPAAPAGEGGEGGSLQEPSPAPPAEVARHPAPATGTPEAAVPLPPPANPARERAHAACDRLALNRDAAPELRGRARQNLLSFVGPAAAMMPSFTARQIDFTPPDGFRPLNPSVAVADGEIALIQRTVNYTLIGGHYVTPDGTPITTRNFLLRLDAALDTRSAAEILPPSDLPPPLFPLVIGFEDPRLFAWRGGLWCVSNVREMTQEGWCEQVLARIAGDPSGAHRLADWRVLHPPGPRLHEKNWMPFVTPAPTEAGDEALRFIYFCDPTRVIDEAAQTLIETLPGIAAENFRGGSQAIAFEDGWLALIHEAAAREGRGCYHHRFVWLDAEYRLRRVSRRFYFNAAGIEFAAGLARHPDGKRLLISYGVDDSQSWLATVSGADAAACLKHQVGPPIQKPGTKRSSNSIFTAFVSPKARSEPTASRVFIHASPRSSSTWLWSKFRSSSKTICFREPFHPVFGSITREQASVN